MKWCFVYLTVLLLCPMPRAAAVTFRGAETNQVIEGFGANVNSRSWNGTELQPVLDALIGQAGLTHFRVIYDNADWEGTNDNADSNVFDWTNYNAIYSSAEFTKLWDMMAYLNQRGITNGAFFNFMGWGPSWMMSNDGRSLKAGMESEWAEMITSLLVYARNTMGLQFNLVAPDNEPDLIPEGIHIPTATQYTNALHKLALRLDSAGMGDIGLVGPDLSGGGTTYLPQMMADPVIMAKLKHFGMHGYSLGGGSSGVRSYLLGSAYPDRTFWMTEFNVWCDSCENGTSGTGNWSYARGTAEYLLAHLLNGASGSQVWEAYDSKYAHGPAYNGVSGTNKWSYWGLLGVDNPNAAVKTYTPRKQFYTHAQISKWVRPGAQRINVTGSASPFSPLLAFKHTGLGQITIVGINTSGSAAILRGTNAALPTVPQLELYYTSATTNLASGGSVLVSTNGAFSATIPANCVFTLAGASNAPSVPTASAPTSATNNAFTATWNGAVGAIGHRLDVSSNAEFNGFVSGYSSLDVGNLTAWTVTGLDSGATYYYRVRAYNSNGVSEDSGTIAVTLPTPAACIGMSNSDFESGFSLAGESAVANNWTEWEATPGVAAGYDETAITHGGGHSQRIRVWGTNATSGGVYQRIPATVGSPVTVSVWTYAPNTESVCSLGVDPAGGTNVNSGVTWSTGTWVQRTWTGIPTANYITVYYKVESPDGSERNGYFDDGTPATAPLQLAVEPQGDALILRWPECPSARLQRANSLSPPVSWALATNQVSVVGGQKTVTVPLVEDPGFFRLIQP